MGDYCICGFGPKRTQRCLRKRTVKLRVRDTPDHIHNEFVQLLNVLNFPSSSFNRDVLEAKAARLARICMCKTCFEDNRLTAVRDELLGQAGSQHRMTKAAQRRADVSTAYREQVSRNIYPDAATTDAIAEDESIELPEAEVQLRKATNKEQRTDGSCLPILSQSRSRQYGGVRTVPTNRNSFPPKL
ncbi:hypothetical protein LTR37_007518 [Vermiconidia calcicola]|uniref:Uncharacterized protein n=1 Tax=Vermiconidia calcicola TaxID=1690605 RepID=A0ACC3NFW5_9PEZI|nr:hypothetical protein LTR37_007518 [Vermiconidia calcicola]